MRKISHTRRSFMRRAASLISVISALLICMQSCAAQTPAVTDADTETTVVSRDTLPFISDEQTTSEPETTQKPDTAKITETETEEPPKVEPLRISFMAMGDNIIYGSTYRQAQKADGTYDFKPKYEGVAELISSPDIAFINQETPMSGEKYGYHSYPQFNTPQQMGRDLIDMGFDIISFANNHMADMGYNSSACLSDMIDYTDTLDAFVIGLYRDYDDFENIRVYEYEGVKIAFLAYTYGTNLYKQQTQPSKITGAYIPVYDEQTVTRQVNAAKRISDLVFVSIHWGAENRHNISEEQQRYAELMADLGVDVIIGHHPHVIQKIEWLQGQNGHDTLCYYSLGNGINAQDYLKNMVGITANFDIVRDDNGVRIENPGCTPIFTVMTPNYKNISLILLEDLTDQIAKNHHCNTKGGPAVTVEAARKIVTDNISEEFLPDYLKNNE